MPKAAVIFNLDERASEPAHHISVGEVADKVQTPRTQRTTRMSLSRDPTNYPAGKILGRDSSQFYESPHQSIVSAAALLRSGRTDQAVSFKRFRNLEQSEGSAH
jgi:hypothetical protein